MTEHRPKVRSLDELEGEIVRAVGDAEVEHARDVTVMQERRKPRFAEKHLDEVGVVHERRENPLQAHALLEAVKPTTNRNERLSHPAYAEAFDQLVVAEVFGGREGHERNKIPQGTDRPPGTLLWPSRAGRGAREASGRVA